MIGVDKFATDNWTVVFPSDWIDKSNDDDTLYFESPEGKKGLYVSLWRISDDEPLRSHELVEALQEAEIASFLPEAENWQLLTQTISSRSNSVVGFWEGLNHERSYRVCGKQVAAGEFVLRATFHDYDCNNRAASAEYFAPIIDSLQLREA